MHDPMTVAFEIKWPFGGAKHQRKDGTVYRYRPSFITIWHVDPCKAGNWRNDDSCGWFMRAGHCDSAGIERTKKDFAFEWCNDWGGWFKKDGTPNLSVIAITLDMFSIAAKARLGTWDKAHKFMKENLYDIMRFAENNVDSMHDLITGRYGFPEKEERINNAAIVVYPYVCRKLRPWYKHPRWHIHHWKIQFHPWQKLKRRYWDKCSKCGKRGFKKHHGGACGNWAGTEIWHSSCEGIKEEIGDCVLYQGDCLEVMPALGKVDADIKPDID